ncbi:MAG: biopolymer transporter ExbD, partial [Elusimicrobiota bacterium]
AKGKAALNKNVRVRLDDKGILRINGKKTAWDQLDAALRAALAKSQDKLVSIDASGKARVGQVVEVLDAAKQNGAKRLALLNK